MFRISLILSEVFAVRAVLSPIAADDDRTTRPLDLLS